MLRHTVSQTTSTPIVDRRGYGFAGGAHLLWGLLPVYWKLVSSISAGQLTAMRVLQTLVIVLGFLWIARRRSPRDLLRGGRATLVHLLASSMLATNWLVFVYAVSTDRVVDLSLGYFISPLVSILLGMAFLGERLNRRSWIAVGLSAIGVGIMSIHAGSLPWISLVVAMAFGFYGLLKKLSPSGPVEGVATEMMWAAPVATCYLAWLGINGRYETGDGTTVALTFLIGVVTAVPLLMFARAARTVPLWALGLMQYIGPSLQFLLGVLVFGESVDPTQLAGFAVIWSGLIVFAHGSWPGEQKVRCAEPRRLGCDDPFKMEPC